MLFRSVGFSGLCRGDFPQWGFWTFSAVWSDIDYDVETNRDEIDDVRVTISASVSSLRVL